ncbi:2-oxoglutarate dehydrogenase E2 component [Bellilinea caldifistulae]|uniref:Dihydrolipoyllysine-residue succinyltransferase component of 2-oxoglutarate dehydrogenase complex n=1 Tax=Bellilinea caldifistulae TaxID=360411 RepID=A0A0P6XT93_9CHLR|nr:2-oxoglutarate dehydrogenase complex dihydrolipoyllysine-residue succinyltransferase [Bellilinea caldifistulae]KPL76326.1 dihydrolipoamide succinyltransferase [Bellilinea caldifistulae]GAP12006.1 2-oxoglutarate dehydrogenase E2 component [Bellilinea caldifistulae]
MSIAVKVPEMGESILEGTVGRWLKKEGEPVRAGEVLLELETDKINLEVSAPADGVLERIEKQAGETVAVGEVLALIAPTEEKQTAPPVSEPSAQTQPLIEKPQPAAPSITPLARKLAEEEGVPLEEISGSGTGGRITREDVLTYLSRQKIAPSEPARSSEPPARPVQPAPQAAPPPVTGERREERIRMSRRRQTIARRLVEAQQTAAMLTTFNEVDMSEIIALRKRYREAFQKRHGVDLGFMSFFVKASVAALREFPNLNAEIQGTEIVRKYYYDIGIAVGDAEGLVVPVLRDAQNLSFAEIERKIGEFVRKAGEGSLTLDDLRGGTFTITNGGVFGSLLSTPILNPPQVGILGMHRIQERPVAVNGQVVIRPMMYLALSYDHRIVDGREAVQFLVRIKQMLEDPGQLLVEIG